MSTQAVEFGLDDYDAQVALIPEGYDEETRIALMAAIAMGWSMTVASGPQGSLKITSPNGKVDHHFSIGRKVRWSRVKRDIMDLAAPACLEALEVTQGAPWEVIETVLFGAGSGKARLVEAKPAPPPVRREVPLHVVKVEPMLAQQKHGAYDSKIALQRTWSDGTVDYKCVKCDHTSENRLSIRSHWRKHINAGEVEAVGQPAKEDIKKGVDVPNAAHYTPRGARVEALAEVLAGMMDGECDPEALAKAALTWVHEQSRKGTRLSGEAEELEDGDILQRIRTLLLTHGEDARNARELETLREQQAALNEEILRAHGETEHLKGKLRDLSDRWEETKEERDRFKERAARAAGDLRALRDLLEGATVDDDEEVTHD